MDDRAQGFKGGWCAYFKVRRICYGDW